MLGLETKNIKWTIHCKACVGSRVGEKTVEGMRTELSRSGPVPRMFTDAHGVKSSVVGHIETRWTLF